MILRAEEGNRKLDGFDMPELDSRFLVIRAEDIPGNNEINILGTTMPLLASDYIAYKGQPLLVLFGPDYENTELALEKIKVNTSKAELTEDETDTPDPLFFSWGLDDNAEADEERAQMKKIESSFEINGGEIPAYVRYSILSWADANGSVHVQCPTQWPTLIRETVSSALQKSPETITVHVDKYNTKYDEYLLAPAFYGAFCAIAADKTRLACEMREEGIASRTGMTFHTVTWVDKNNRPRHEETTVVIDQGAWSIAGKELQRQTMVGIIPKYPLESFKAMIRTQRSSTRPSMFCGSMISSAALSSRGIHTSRLASRLELTPSSFILDTNKDATRFTDWAPRHDLTDLEVKVRKVSTKSDFDRKWSSTSLHSGSFGLQGYLYGIGLSSGLSTSGFSTTMAKDSQFMAQISYSTKKNVTIAGCIPSSVSLDRTLKDTLCEVFSFSEEEKQILFLEGTQKTPDSGPDLLSSYPSIFLSQLMKATVKLSQLSKVEDAELPVVLKFNAQNLALPCEFEYSGFGSAVAEVIIPKVSLIPEVKKVWIDCALALPYTKGVKEKIRSTAMLAIQALGIKISDSFDIAVNLTSERKEVGTYSSIDNLVRALVTSAVSSALWQALGSKSTMSMPVSDKDIETILRGGER